MGFEQQLMLQVNTLLKEAQQSLSVLANREDELEAELSRVKTDREQMRGVIASIKKVNDFYNELMSQPDEIRKLDGMK
ncbi:hypothetical protein LCGC14_2475800 [marine sediment metagenome]|uniref:Uncharacterized protein n=1 Tax=marine sediment metagenome TaxID=412755 RepID=A0A0F9B9T4_9ZZZZ